MRPPSPSSRRGAPPVAVIGAGFCGLAAAYELSLRGVPVVVYERDPEVGGLAGSFEVGGTRLERFYHHWFRSDEHVMGLIEELGVGDKVIDRASRTGLFYANRRYRLSTPLDLLRFDALPWVDRIRLGIMTLRARRVDDWRQLEGRTAREWLVSMGGRRVYEVVWEPLLRGKFGDAADEVSAVWFWNKLKLRGGSRGSGGGERLLYFEGGFAALAETLAARIRDRGGRVLTDVAVEGVEVDDGRVTAVHAAGERQAVSAVLATAPLPQIAQLVEPHIPDAALQTLLRIRYLGNVCIVLELDRSLMDTYWLNVNDPSFPFVGVIEHTNFEPPETYAGRHVVYLSTYLPESAELYGLADDDAVRFSLEHVKRMFPDFSADWVQGSHVWRAAYSQPIVERHYGDLIAAIDVPLDGFEVATMAQIYPEDRGTNYAVRQGREAARALAERLAAETSPRA